MGWSKRLNNRALARAGKPRAMEMVDERTIARLLPCPFCGEPATIASRTLHGGPCWCAYCRNGECAVAPASDYHKTQEDAAGAWNTRALAPAPAGDAWQDIATAPRDGARFLIACANGAIYVAWWDDQFTPRFNETTEELVYEGAWTDGTIESWGYERTNSYTPTHWQPLPEPPCPAAAQPREDGET